MTRYYDVHVFYSKKDGYSLPIMIETEKFLTEEEVINYVTENDLLNDEGDQNQIDYVSELDEDLYNSMVE